MAQGNTAVDVSDPVRLVRHLEVVVGNAGYEQRIAEERARLDGLKQQLDDLGKEAAE